MTSTTIDMLRFDLIWLTFLLTVGRWKVVYKLQFQASGAQFSAACIHVESFQIGHLSNWKSLFTLILISQGRARKHCQRHNWPMSWHHKLELGSVPKPFLRNPSVTEFVSKKTLRIGDPPSFADGSGKNFRQNHYFSAYTYLVANLDTRHQVAALAKV